MGFWSRLLGYTTREERAGKSMEDPDPWLILPPRAPANVLRSLPILVPSAGFVYFEDTMEIYFEHWLSENAIPEPIRIALGTIWPKPNFYHIPLTPELISRATDIIEKKRISLPSIHLHVHNGEQILCEWFDAFGNDPMLVSSAIPKEQIEAFVKAIDAKYIIKRSEENQIK